MHALAGQALARQLRDRGKVAGEQLVELIGVQRVGEIETLGHLAAEHLEPHDLALVSTPSATVAIPMASAQVDDGPDDRRPDRFWGGISIHKLRFWLLPSNSMEISSQPELRI